tara:strand:+ start:249 stop:728 length:480 start_codon:yes stop_codon:yes gene_type:complete
MISAITSMVAGIELVTELLSAAVILMALDKLATAIRWTYAAGRYTGRLWFTYGLPAFLMVADGISWLNSQIDWRFVAATVWDCLKVVTALAITAYSLTCDAHKRWIGSINWDLPAAPAINPLFEIAAELEQLTGKQLKAITGSRRRAAKRELVAAYMAR